MPLRDRGTRAGYLDPVIIADIDDGVEIPIKVADGTVLPTGDLMLEVSRGNVTGMSGVNKFGRSLNVDAADTDIWDRANTGNDQKIWVAPTQSRIHNIVSSSSNDDGDPVGTGARTIEVFGLVNWDTAETSEIITMNGIGNVPTANAYVIIHRMFVLTNGATSPNVGTITATAQTDGSVTAQIEPGEGQTQMAIYGIPSTKAGYMPRLYANLNKQGTGTADIALLVNNPSASPLPTFITKHTFSIVAAGTSAFTIPYQPYKRFAGPLIIKVQATGSTVNLDVSAGFDLILVDN